jgi:hypothetical protein
LLFGVNIPIVIGQILMPARWGLGSKGVDDEVWDPALHVCLEHHGKACRVGVIRYRTDDDSGEDCLSPVAKEYMVSDIGAEPTN